MLDFMQLAAIVVSSNGLLLLRYKTDKSAGAFYNNI
jgi:hypothetical protein